MNKFQKYLGKKVVIVDDENKKWSGIIATYELAIDNDEGKNWISLKREGWSGLVDFEESEIKSIEVVE
jgi:hypothetical protein